MLRLRAVFAAIADAVVISGVPNGLIIDVNPAAEALFGRRRDDLVGSPIIDLHGPGVAPPPAEVFPVLVAGGTWEGRLPLPPDGRGPRTSLVRISPVHDDSGILVAAVGVTRDITHEARIAADLKDAEAQLSTMLDVTPIGLILLDSLGRIVRVNEPFVSLFGYTRAELLALPPGELTPEEDRPAARESFDELLSGGSDIARLEQRVRHRDGHDVWCEVSFGVMRDEATGAPAFIGAAILEITERRKTAERLSAIAAAQLAFATIELSPRKVMREICRHAQDLTHGDGAGVYLVEGDGEMVIRAASGASAGAEGRRMPISGLAGVVLSTGEAQHCTDSETDPRVELATARAAGARSILMAPLRQGSQVFGLVAVGALEPERFTEEDRQALAVLAGPFGTAMAHAWQLENASQQAATDGLTGLTNRVAALAILDQVLRRQTRAVGPTAVLFIDLDGFKRVNDELGHEAGDRVLVEVADRLRTAVRIGDTAARYGGDEFLVVCGDLTSPEDADGLARRLLAVLPGEYRTDDTTSAVIGASIGVAVTGALAQAPGDLLRAADEAMYEAKEAGGNGFRTQRFF